MSDIKDVILKNTAHLTFAERAELIASLTKANEKLGYFEKMDFRCLTRESFSGIEVKSVKVKPITEGEPYLVINRVEADDEGFYPIEERFNAEAMIEMVITIDELVNPGISTPRTRTLGYYLGRYDNGTYMRRINGAAHASLTGDQPVSSIALAASHDVNCIMHLLREELGAISQYLMVSQAFDLPAATPQPAGVSKPVNC